MRSKLKPKLQLLFLVLFIMVLFSQVEFASAKEVTTMNTSNYEPTNFKLEVENDVLVFRQIPDAFEQCKLYIRIYSEKYNKEVMREIYPFNVGTISIPLASYEDDTYRIHLYYNDGTGNSNSYEAYWWNDNAPKITKNLGKYSFVFGQYYDEVVDIHNKIGEYDYFLDYYTNSTEWLDFKDNTIVEKAKEITKNSKTDYEKVRAIYEWVIHNIYYDYDGLNGITEIESDPAEVLKSKKGVCQGYANLTAAFLRNLGIPAIVASGNGASPINKEDTNHGWNMVYADGRWIFLDTTWDSRNRYEEGKYKKNPPNLNRTWFDTSLEIISLSHYITGDVYLPVVYNLFESGEDEQEVDVTYGTVKVPLKKVQLPEGYELVYELDEDYKKTAYISKGNLVVTGNVETDEIVIYYKIKIHGKEANFEYYTFVNIIDECLLKTQKLPSENMVKGDPYYFSDFVLAGELGSKVKYKVSYSTSNKKVATMSKKGIVVAKTKGTAIVKAVVKVGTQTFTYKQTIKVK